MLRCNLLTYFMLRCKLFSGLIAKLKTFGDGKSHSWGGNGGQSLNGIYRWSTLLHHPSSFSAWATAAAVLAVAKCSLGNSRRIAGDFATCWRRGMNIFNALAEQHELHRLHTAVPVLWESWMRVERRHPFLLADVVETRAKLFQRICLGFTWTPWALRISEGGRLGFPRWHACGQAYVIITVHYSNSLWTYYQYKRAIEALDTAQLALSKEASCPFRNGRRLTWLADCLAGPCLLQTCEAKQPWKTSKWCFLRTWRGLPSLTRKTWRSWSWWLVRRARVYIDLHPWLFIAAKL